MYPSTFNSWNSLNYFPSESNFPRLKSPWLHSPENIRFLIGQWWAREPLIGQQRTLAHLWTRCFRSHNNGSLDPEPDHQTDFLRDRIHRTKFYIKRTLYRRKAENHWDNTIFLLRFSRRIPNHLFNLFLWAWAPYFTASDQTFIFLHVRVICEVSHPVAVRQLACKCLV